jgi:hypothetical protein
MQIHSRRQILSSLTLLLGSGLSTLPTNALTADELYAGDPEVIKKWMEAWMGGSRATKGLLQLARFADPVYVLTKSIEWHPSLPEHQKFKSVVVPKYFVTDLASIPRFFWIWLRPDGLYAYAANLYWSQEQSFEDANAILKIVMQEFAVPTEQLYAIYGAVSWFGKSAWETDIKLRNSGERRILKGLPDSPTMTWAEYKKLPDVFSPQ